MEQKKTLWIIAAVGVFMLVVLGGAAILFVPAKNTYPAVASVSPVAKGNTAVNTGWTNTSVNDSVDTLPVAIPTDGVKTNDLVVLADNATVYELAKTDASGTTIDLNSLKREIVAETQPQNINITVNIPDTKIETSEYSKAVSEPKVETKSASTPVQKAKTVTKTNTTSTAKTAAAPAKTEPKKTQFWVQVAAYSNKKGAEGARSVLDANKIPSDIFTFKDNKDKMFYRVRVGPYTTKSEAEYWRTRIIKIDEFSKAESYITSTTN